MATRTLVRGGCVLTLGARTTNHAQADVLIEDGVITAVGPGLRARDAEVIDAVDAIVMPGFVDGHHHLWRSVLRGIGGDPSALDVAARVGPLLSPDELHTATLLGLVAAAESGTTTVVDWCEVAADAAALDAVIEAHREAGLRAVLVAPPAAWAPDADPARLERMVAAAAASDGLLEVAVGHPDVGIGDASRFAACRSRARDLGLRVHVHVGASPDDAGRLAALVNEGLIDGDVTVVHVTHCDDADLDALASTGAGVVLTPSHELATSTVAPPLQRLIDRGMRHGLGVNDLMSAATDLFSEMRTTQSLQHATSFDRKLAGKGAVPTLVTTRDVIRTATSEGARAIGATRTGSLEPGRAADLIVLRTDRPNIFPVNDPIGAVVWGMDPSNVDTVLVAGRAVVREGVPATDVTALRSRAMTVVGRLASASGEAALAGVVAR